jgi:hypothetical protein
LVAPINELTGQIGHVQILLSAPVTGAEGAPKTVTK